MGKKESGTVNVSDGPHMPVKRRGTRRWVAGVLALILATFAAGAIYVKRSLEPVTTEAGPLSFFKIGANATPEQIGAELERRGIVRNGYLFSQVARLIHWRQGSQFQPGEYEVQSAMPALTIVEMFDQGLVTRNTPVKLTIPEGYTVRQIVERIAQQFGTDSTQLMTIIQQSNSLSAKALKDIPQDARLRYRLEGYLFPDTYEFRKLTTKPEEFIEKMTQELDRKLSQLPEDWQQVMASRKLTLHQVLTIASLIERETAVDEERPLVSSVIANRIRKGMPLQIDATVQYLFDKQKERLFERDLQVDSPYNTYIVKGLPPGPIASPGIASIKAALYPVESPYLYYVTKKDGTRGHYFSETFEGHKANITTSKKTAANGGQ